MWQEVLFKLPFRRHSRRILINGPKNRSLGQTAADRAPTPKAPLGSRAGTGHAVQIGSTRLRRLLGGDLRQAFCRRPHVTSATLHIGSRKRGL